MQRVNEDEMKKMLGSQAENFTAAGIRFLKCRYNGDEHALTSTLITKLTEGTLQVPDTQLKPLAKLFGYPPQPPAMAIFILGRMPAKARTGDKFSDSSKSLTGPQEKMADAIVEELDLDHRYVNRKRDASGKPVAAKEEKSAEKEPKQEEEKEQKKEDKPAEKEPAKEEKPPEQKKEEKPVAKPPATRRKAPARKKKVTA